MLYHVVASATNVTRITVDETMSILPVFSHFPVLLGNFISSDDVFTCPYDKFVYTCVTVVIHFVLSRCCTP